jgi:hypothetical protein
MLQVSSWYVKFIRILSLLLLLRWYFSAFGRE